MSEYRDTAAGTLGIESVGKTVKIAGWVARRRDHGGVAFIDVRDASGIVQIVADPDVIAEVASLRMEFCISVTGDVRPRPEGTINPDLPTGMVEIGAAQIDILSPSEALPFMLDDRVEVDERVRLEYRYLDLRRTSMAANIAARSKATAAIRRSLDDRGFLEIETPTLVASTPEGARDMLVPSRLREGHFYALPQSPQLFKQLLMVSGVERYFQIARCYRDEDLRSDRQLEFTQLDLEGSFWGQDEVLDTIEQTLVAATEAVRGVRLTEPFPRLTWQQVMDRYGSDKPDIRFGMEIVDVAELFASSAFGVFTSALESGGVIRGINAGTRDFPRSKADELTEVAKANGAKGLVWMVVNDDGSIRSPIAKFLGDSELSGVVSRFDAKPGDVLLLVADRWKTAVSVLGTLRSMLGRPEGHDELAFLWVTDFPMFEEEDDGSITFSHHPFTTPQDVDVMATEPEKALARAYDAVLNGVELGSGSVRIHDPVLQQQVFDILGIDSETAERMFGWFLRALRFGPPPHAGFAFGIDRLVMILQNEESIREVIPFPKTQSGVDPLTGSPTLVDDRQLSELGITLRPETRTKIEES
jgi:aspartyl-tRNA synthetase